MRNALARTPSLGQAMSGAWSSLVLDSRAQTTSLPKQRSLHTASQSFVRVRLGICEDYPEESSTPSLIQQDFNLLHESGLNVLRISVAWGDVEPQPGQYRWDYLDGLVQMAQASGITLIPYVCYAPKWASARSDQEDFWRHPLRCNDDFARFMRNLASRYRHTIHTWEIWNEPDNADFWRGSTADYAALLQAGSAAVRQAHPEAKVVLGGLAWNLSFLNELLRDHGASRWVDIVNLHNYYETWIDQPAEQIIDFVNRAADIITQYGNHQPIWMAELGYSTYRRGEHVSAQYSALFDYEHTPQYQAAVVIRTLAMLLATQKLQTIAWYELRELPVDAKVIGDVNNCFLGITDTELTPKPALSALRFFQQMMNLPHRCIDDDVTISRHVRSDSHVHCFEQSDGSVIIVAWLKTFVPGRRCRRDTASGHDNRMETVRLAVPHNGATTAKIYDAVGHLRETVRLTTDDDIARLRILLRGGQVFVVEIR